MADRKKEQTAFDGIIDPQLITKVECVGFDEADEYLDALVDVEPYLAAWIKSEADRIRGCYAMQDAEQEFCELMERETRWLLWAAVEMMRRGHHRLWADDLTNEQLAANMKLDAKTKRRLKGRRRKG